MIASLLNVLSISVLITCFSVLAFHPKIDLEPYLRLALIAGITFGLGLLFGTKYLDKAAIGFNSILAILCLLFTWRLYKREVLKLYTRSGDRI